MSMMPIPKKVYDDGRTGKMEGEELEKLTTGLECVSASREINQNKVQQLHRETA